MDANGLRFWMLADEKDWLPLDEPAGTYYDRARRSLRLVSRSERTIDLAPVPLSTAASRLERVPETRDAYGMRAYWDPVSGQVMATGALPGVVPILTPPAGTRPGDLAMGYDGVLYVTLDSGALLMQDRRDRWVPVLLQAGGFTAWRLAADPAGGAWVLDRLSRRIGRLQGLPFPDRPQGSYAPGTFRPNPENPNPPRLAVDDDPFCPSDERPVALACSPEGTVAVLTWTDPGGETRLRVRRTDGRFSPPCTLAGAPLAYSLAWVSNEDVAALLANADVHEAPVFKIGSLLGSSPPARANPTGDLYPVTDSFGDPFVHGLDLPPHYTIVPPPNPDPLYPQPPTATTPLYHLSLPSYVPAGAAVSAPDTPLDSGSTQTAWHRLYVEADIPPGCGVRVFVAATDVADVEIAAEDWHEHRFGQIFARGAGSGGNGNGANGADNRTPRGAWVPAPSEVPFSDGLLQCPQVRDRSGLFTALIQRANRPVRTLRGRFLRVRVELSGDGRASPEVAAVRAYASRFSYLNRYLPQMYRENRFGPDADQVIADATSRVTTPADFLERFLDNFEGILTPLEDRIAASYLLTDPVATPNDALEWLGSWIGMSFDPAYPVERRRTMLIQAPDLYREHGTLQGLERALDIATGGGVSNGQIVVVEDFRLRRTFATILGADLADEDDPLLAGISVSGNSFVGDTLFLGDENKKEFLALFGLDALRGQEEEQAVAALFDSLAHRVTVLVHEEVVPQDLGLIRRVVDAETPAHVQATVATASQPFIVGVASLVGVDSYLSPKPRPGPVRVGSSQIGLRDLILHPPSLDPRLEAGRYGQAPPVQQRPTAVAGPPVVAHDGDNFTLDGSASHAAPGRKITTYVWTLLE